MSYMGGVDSWGAGNTIGKVYLAEPERFGINKGVKKGTPCLCVDHTGDCFYYYVPIKTYIGKSGKKFISASLNKEFGSYTFGKLAKKQFTNREYHLLLAGETL